LSIQNNKLAPHLKKVVVTTDEQYPQHGWDFTQDKCDLLNNYNVGEDVKVSINLRGREWVSPEETKYFNSIQGWRIEKLAAEARTFSSYASCSNVCPTNLNEEEEPDDLPF
jgi:hypothetical protein